MHKTSRVTYKRSIRQSLGESRRFVEGYFGRGSASVKVTFNTDTINRAHQNMLKTSKKKQESIDFTSTGAALVSVGNKGVKHIMFLRKKNQKYDYMYVHEHTHAAYFRTRKRKGKRILILISEILSSSLQFEWLLKENNYNHFDDLMYRGEQNYAKLVKGKLVHDGTLNSKAFTNTSVGSALAYRIFTRFPLAERTRRKLIQDLRNKEFTTPRQALNWIENYS